MAKGLPLLSVLIPGVPTRLEMGRAVVEEFQSQIKEYSLENAVEVIWFVDNFHRTIGEKRQSLVNLARGKYIIFNDDDDWIVKDYLKKILLACMKNPDVVTFQQDVDWNGVRGIIEFGLGNEVERFGPSPQITKRPPWHVCAWKREIALKCRFPSLNWGEDSPWVLAASSFAKTSEHIPEILQIYSHYDHTSESSKRLAAEGQ